MTSVNRPKGVQRIVLTDVATGTTYERAMGRIWITEPQGHGTRGRSVATSRGWARQHNKEPSNA